MKPEMVKLEHKGIHFKVARPKLAEIAIASLFSQAVPAANAAPATPTNIPDLGAYWPGEGGINGGFVPARGDVPAHCLIFSDMDAGKAVWGGRGEESKATSKTDGLANTGILLAEGDHPAAELAEQYTADGHSDFYLPAAAELYQGWVNCQGIFSNSDWYWSSSQRSAYYAFTMDFGDGYLRARIHAKACAKTRKSQGTITQTISSGRPSMTNPLQN